MIKLDYSDHRIYAIPTDSEAIGILFDVLDGKDYAKDVGGVWMIKRSYVDELAEDLKPYSKHLELSRTFKDHAEEFRSHYTEESEFKSKRKVIIHAFPNYSKVVSKDYPKEKLDKAMKYFFKAAKNSKKYKEGKWDGYLHLFDERKKTFPTGLLYIAKEICIKNGYAYKIVYKYNRRPERRYEWYVDDGLVPDPDQLEAVHKAFEAGRSVVKAPTGFGKTCILAKRLTAAFGVRTLFVANKKALLDDAKEEFEAGIVGLGKGAVGEIKDGVFGRMKLTAETTEADIPDLDMPVMVATIQSLDAKLKDPRTRAKLKEWLKGVQFLMVVSISAVPARG